MSTKPAAIPNGAHGRRTCRRCGCRARARGGTSAHQPRCLPGLEAPPLPHRQRRHSSELNAHPPAGRGRRAAATHRPTLVVAVGSGRSAAGDPRQRSDTTHPAWHHPSRTRKRPTSAPSWSERTGCSVSLPFNRSISTSRNRPPSFTREPQPSPCCSPKADAWVRTTGSNGPTSSPQPSCPTSSESATQSRNAEPPVTRTPGSDHHLQ